MREGIDPSGPETWFSAVLLVLGGFDIIAAALVVLSGRGVALGLCLLGSALAMIALGRVLDQFERLTRRLTRFEKRASKGPDTNKEGQ